MVRLLRPSVQALCASHLMKDAQHDELKQDILQNRCWGRLSRTAKEQEGDIYVTVSITVVLCDCDSQVCCSATTTSCCASFAWCCISFCENIANSNTAELLRRSRQHWCATTLPNLEETARHLVESQLWGGDSYKAVGHKPNVDFFGG